jgi:hypothetical protein
MSKRPPTHPPTRACTHVNVELGSISLPFRTCTKLVRRDSGPVGDLDSEMRDSDPDDDRRDSVMSSRSRGRPFADSDCRRCFFSEESGRSLPARAASAPSERDVGAVDGRKTPVKPGWTFVAMPPFQVPGSPSGSPLGMSGCTLCMLPVRRHSPIGVRGAVAANTTAAMARIHREPRKTFLGAHGQKARPRVCHKNARAKNHRRRYCNTRVLSPAS